MVLPPSLSLSLFFIYNISFYSLPPIFNISQMHRLQTDIAPTQNKTRSSEKKKKNPTELVLATLVQELIIDYMSRWIFKNVTSKQTSFVTNINTVRCSRNAC